METVFAQNRAEWRRWLAKNHSCVTEVLLAFYKKTSGKQTVSYEEAVEEALCFGWVDGLKKRLNEECYTFRFTPRKAKSFWSQSNLDRVERLMAQGKMMPAGLAAYNSGQRRDGPPTPTDLPRELEARFRKQRAAWANYAKFPPGYRRMTAGWVAMAKKEETRMKRLEKLIESSARNEHIEFM
ncbi:MAG TPA: YdeI/OmpD-associated family protein [Bryobacteraceae bacterium]|nr:YdeI/OmpD-associated family protein [Bryobacteraceae bacterium]